MRRNLPRIASARQSIDRTPALLLTAACAAILTGCTTPEGPPAPDPAPAPAEEAPAEEAPVTAADPSPPGPGEPSAAVSLGVDVLLRDHGHGIGGRAGLITNHTGLSWAAGDAVSTIDRLAGAPGVELVALFSPEHGIRGEAEAGEKVESGIDAATGLPIHSLYGATRRPTPDMLAGLDVLIFDIQDVGARYYTYVWTMAEAMQAAGEVGIPFVVLDRPNPLGGGLVQGNVLDPAFATFVGLYPVPMRHGLTVGELARLLVGEFGLRVELRVVPMEGWTRSMWYDETGLPFVPPSPNMPSLASATHYPGSCLFEGTSLSVGRGTDRAFQQVGAPWLDAERITAALNRRPELHGARFEPVTFVPRSPGDGKFDGEVVRGIRFITTDRERYDPTRAAIAALIEIHRAHPDRLEWRVSHFDRLAGTDRVRLAIEAGRDVEWVTQSWAEQVAAFESVRERYLLYW